MILYLGTAAAVVAADTGSTAQVSYLVYCYDYHDT